MSEPIGPEPSATVVEPLAHDERAELERLRQEVETLRAAGPRRRRTPNWKSVAAGFLITLGCILAPLSLMTVWVHNQVSDTDRFVATMSPLIDEPSVQAAVTDRVSDTIFGYVDVQGLATQAVDALAAQGLPPVVVDRLQGLTGPLTSSVHGFVHDRVAGLVASPQIQAAWDQAIRLGHEQMNAVLSGNASAVTIAGDEVRLDLAPFITVAKQQLAAAGLTAVNRVPDVHPTIAVGDAATLVQAKSAYNTLDKVATWLPWITLILLAAGVYLARNHRRALVTTGFGFATGMVVLAVALFVVRSILISNVPSRSAAPAGAAYDLVVRFLRDGVRTAFVVGLLLALGAFLAGPSTTAVRIRGALSRFVGWLRRGGAKAGLKTGPVGGWVHAHLTALRIAVVAVAVLVFVFLSTPSGAAAIVIAVLLVVCLAVIQFLDQPPAERGGHAGTGAA